MSRLIATFFYSGYLRPAPGSWGSLAALVAAYFIASVLGVTGFVVALVLVVPLGVWATAREIERQAEHDPSHVVIDEVAGQWIAVLPVVIGARYSGASLEALWPGWIAAFALFRLFDILKPGPIGWADKRADAIGVMLDDLLAGLAAAFCVVLLGALAHGVIL